MIVAYLTFYNLPTYYNILFLKKSLKMNYFNLTSQMVYSIDLSTKMTNQIVYCATNQND
jgi:hypothetical protein